MKLGDFEVPGTIASRVSDLLERARDHPFRGYAPPDTTVETRLIETLDRLARQGLDWEAALLAFSAVHYLSDDEGLDLWSQTGPLIKSWYESHGCKDDDVYYFQVENESHINTLFSACKWKGRSELPGPRDVEGLWQYIDSVRTGRAATRYTEGLRVVDERSVWVLLWDLNLSGQTASTEIRRLHRCMQMMPTARSRHLVVAGLLLSTEALESIKRTASSLKVEVRCIYARSLTESDRLENHAGLESAERDRITALCNAVYETWLLPEKQKAAKAGKERLFRDVGPLGYQNGGWLLVLRDNCPNNTLPLLWLHSEHHSVPYAGPFPRRFSKLGHKSTADHTLDELTQERLGDISVTLAFYLRTPEDQRRIRKRPYTAWKQEVHCVVNLADQGDPEKLEIAHAKVLHLLGELPADELRIRFEALVAHATVALHFRPDEWPQIYQEIRRLQADGIRSEIMESWLDKNAKDFLDLATGGGVPGLPSTSPSLPPRRYSPTGPPRELELHAGGPEPLTTRRPAATSWGSDLVRQMKTARGALYLVVGTSGWGKSVFTRLGIQSINSPMLHVDLADVETAQQVGYALLDGAHGAQVSAEDERLIDRHPLRAIDILERLVDRPCLIVIENAHRTSAGHPAPGLARFLRTLVRLGYTVVLESWSDAQTTPPLETGSDAIRIIDRSTLVSLDETEINTWAHAVLDHDPGDDLVESLSLFDGHPRKIRTALEFLQDHTISPGAVADTMIELAIELDRDNVYERFIAGLPDDLACWLSVFPWAEIPEEWLSNSSRSRFHVLSATGLVSRDQTAGTWCGYAWARTLALRQLAHKPELVSHYEDLLDRLALRVPRWQLRVQRRHIAALISRLQHEAAQAVLAHLLESMPYPEKAIAEHQDTPRLEMPAEIEPRFIKLPPDIAAWAMEGAARRGDVAALVGLMRFITDALDESASYFAGDWQLLKSVHRALAILPSAEERRHELYVELVPVILRALESAGIIERAWCVRFLAFAAATARVARRFSLSEEWLGLSQSAQERMPIPSPGTFGRHVYDDTVYFIHTVRCRAGLRLEDFIQAHIDALQSIPPTDAQAPEHKELWAYRTLQHLKPVLRAAETNSNLTSRLRATLVDLPASPRWFYHLHRYQVDAAVLPKEVGPILIGSLVKKVSDLQNDPRADPRLLDLARLLSPETPATPDIVALMKRVATKVEDGLDAVDMDIFHHCLRILRRTSANEILGWRREAADACDTVLNYLRMYAVLLANDDIAVELRRHCLNYMENHYLHPLRLAYEEERDGLSEGARAKVRIDAMYRAHASATGDPWLWDDWAAAAIHIVRARAFGKSNNDATQEAIDRYLADVQTQVDRAIAPHPAADAVAVRTLRYRWHFEKCLERAMHLLKQPLRGRMRLRVVHLGLDLLNPIALEPPLLRYWNPPEPHRAKLVFIYKQLLHEHAAMVGRQQARYWAQAAIAVLDDELKADGWTELIEPLKNRMGPLKELWWTVISRQSSVESVPGEPKHDMLELLDDLTDSTSILLVGTLLRFGASDESLPRALRKSLADLAVISGFHTESWERSVGRGLAVDVTLHEGYAIALALALSDDGLVCDEKEPGLTTRRGGSLTWRDLMYDRLSITQSKAFGRFHNFVKEVRNVMRAMVNVPVA